MTPAPRLAQLRLAMMMLTRLPVGRLSEPVPTLAEAQWAFPLVGLPVGLVGMAAVVQAIAMMARKRLDGQTGHVLGAVQLSAEAAGWILVAALF